jgi:hypothetical protein
MADEMPTLGDAPARRGSIVPRWFAALLVLLLVGGVGFAIGYAVTPGSDDATVGATPQPPEGTTPGGSGGSSAPTSPRNPNQELADAGLRRSDLRDGVSLVLIPGGDSPAGGPTLDLCNGEFPSESQRRARIQVAAIDTRGTVSLSTEAVQYTNAAATEQAFEELQSVAASCPKTPVESPDGDGPATTTFRATPDGSWPRVDGVERRAFDMDTTNASGDEQRSIAVYLRRGRVLMGLYFPRPDAAQTAVAGQSTVQGVVNLFEQRMAGLPDSLVQD